LQAF
jgi:hypothetical protein